MCICMEKFKKIQLLLQEILQIKAFNNLSESNASSYQRNVSVLSFFECLFWMPDQIHEKKCRLFMSICMHKIKVIPPLFLQIRLIKENYNLIKPMLRVTHSFSLYWMSIYMKENQKESYNLMGWEYLRAKLDKKNFAWFGIFYFDLLSIQIITIKDQLENFK